MHIILYKESNLICQEQYKNLIITSNSSRYLKTSKFRIIENSLSYTDGEENGENDL